MISFNKSPFIQYAYHFRATKLIALFIASISLAASGAEVSVFGDTKLGGVGLTLEGEIKQGDFSKILSYEQEKRVDSIMISSPGGSVSEALKIGKFANDNMVSCFAKEVCNSSCFLILASCGERSTSVDVGIHRPFFNPDDFGAIPFDEAKAQYNKMLNDVSNHLEQMEVPQTLIEKIIKTPSNRVYYISNDDFEAVVGKYSPAFEEWVIAKCGTLTKNQENDFKHIKNSDLYSIVYSAFSQLESSQISTEDAEALRYLRKSKNYIDKLDEGYVEILSEKGYSIEKCKTESLVSNR